MQIINTILSAKESNSQDSLYETSNIFRTIINSYSVLTNILSKYYRLFLIDFSHFRNDPLQPTAYLVENSTKSIRSTNKGFVENKDSKVWVSKSKIITLNDFDQLFSEALKTSYLLTSLEKNSSDLCKSETIFLSEKDYNQNKNLFGPNDYDIIEIAGDNSYAIHLSTIPVGLLSISDDSSFFVKDEKFSSDGGLNIGMIFFDCDHLFKINFT